MAAIDSITDYSKTQRVVLLIDLNPLLQLKDPNPYLTSLLSAAKTLLSFPPLSSSLFSFKPFFSSLSPLLCSSKLSIPSLSLSFDHPNSTLESLTQTLTSLLSTIDRASIPSLSPRALHLAASMRQLVHDYAWDSVICDSLAGTLSNCGSFVKSNLVVLFSPIISSLKGLSEFLSVDTNDECLRNVDGLIKKFRESFESVNEAFVSRDIHFSWVDVKYETACGAYDQGFEEPELECGFFKNGIGDLGWGYCSSECIVLGSALVPFGLIYPRIGISPRLMTCDSCQAINAQLSLEILDVSEKPLECKCCDVELVNFNGFSEISSKFVGPQTYRFEQEKMDWGNLSHGVTKLHVKAVKKHVKCVKLERFLSDPILVRELSRDSEKGQSDSCSELFEDRVLEILRMEKDNLVPRRSVPIWEILFSFLYREDYWAFVSLSNSNGNSLTGILKPFTVSLALLSIIRDHSIINEFEGAGIGQFVNKTDSEICKSQFDLSQSFGLVGPHSGPSPSEKSAEVGDGKRKKKKSLNMLGELTWSAFCKAAVEQLQIDLEDIYFSRGCSKSKKLKFLKCWMKQVKKSSTCSLTMHEKAKPHQPVPKEMDNRLTKLPQECEQPIPSCSSVGEDSLTGASRIQDEVALDFCSDASESFFNDLPCKIQLGIESEEVELGPLANRLVKSSIYWLYQKHEKETVSESQMHVVRSDDPSGRIVADELTKLILKDPKVLAAMHRNRDLSSQVSNPSAAEVTSEHIVREYELQILFRMEILQSDVGAGFGESAKQKFVKQICLLLETVQCHLQGGFFGDWSLEKYMEKIIKDRYCQSLGDVVQRIYAKMDMLLFEDEDEDESPNSLQSSEDINQFPKKHRGDEIDENCTNNNPVCAEDESFQLVGNEHESPQGIKREEHARKLIEAQERRQRARRFASFTSWVPDLQKVWAPKQPKAMKVRSDPLRKLFKRKERRRVSYDTVCETPITGKKRSQGGDSSGEEDRQDNGTPFCGSVSKALFQDY